MSATSSVGPGVWCVTAGVFPSNCYIVQLGETDRCVLLDPGLDGAAIETAVTQLKLTPAAVLCTHGHFDHVGSAAVFQQRYECPVYLHKHDLKMMKSANFLLMAFKIETRIDLPEVLLLEDDTSTINVEGHVFSFYLTPGHTPGSIVIKSGSFLFTGDTLYVGGVGFSKLPGEQPEELRRSATYILAHFSGTDHVCPGHGKTASLSWVQKNNLALQNFLREQ